MSVVKKQILNHSCCCAAQLGQPRLESLLCRTAGPAPTIKIIKLDKDGNYIGDDKKIEYFNYEEKIRLLNYMIQNY